MKTRWSARWGLGLLTLAIWALAAGSVWFWGLRLGSGTPAQAVPAAGGEPPGGLAVDTRQVARALGAAQVSSAPGPAPDVLSRLALRGVVTQAGRGAALIAIDGKPPQPVRVGAALPGVDGWTVQAVMPHAVTLAAGERQAQLDMPPLAQRSTLKDAVAPARPGPAPAPPPVQPTAPAPVPPQALPGGVLPAAPLPAPAASR